MIQPIFEYDPDAPVILVDIGNTSVDVATWHEDSVKTPLSIPTCDATAFEAAYCALVKEMGAGEPAATVIASVVPDVLERINSYVVEQRDRDPLVIGERIPLPLEVDVRDAKAIGADRVCTAAAAYEQIQRACTVVDFGTAVTVDLVDDEGTLSGGAILPGLKLQLGALCEKTSQLPEVEPGVPETPYGRDTVEAMQVGVCRGLAGAVRGLVEGYASSVNHWPQVIATGGDLALMMPLCDFVDTAVEHLTLRGIGLAYNKHMQALGP